VTATGSDPLVTEPEPSTDDVLIAGPVRVDTRRYEVHLRNREIRLTVREIDLLVFLIRRRGLVASTGEISDAVWHGPTTTNTVTVHINRLRVKLGDDPQHGMMIRTVRGVGYRLAPSLCESA
jgi:DNA-binding response OmpR family regulator